MHEEAYRITNKGRVLVLLLEEYPGLDFHGAVGMVDQLFGSAAICEQLELSGVLDVI